MYRLLGVLGALQEDEEAEEVGEDADSYEEVKRDRANLRGGYRESGEIRDS
jgi:hypothetical protein